MPSPEWNKMELEKKELTSRSAVSDNDGHDSRALHYRDRTINYSLKMFVRSY